MYTDITQVRKTLKGIDSSIIPNSSETEFSIDYAITKAGRIIDAHLGDQFEMPQPAPEAIVEIATELSASFCLEYLYSEENGGFFETAHRKYRRAVELLTDIRNGKSSIGLEAKPDWEGLWVC
ncbi:MAG TPA: DUF1320 family protein [Caldisericia bacterium]|nr:DUF1320 family protein [Caldisericia bacterium]HPF48611.1 DUF1320 family protein [Caldisericia bacterium]HPI83729.1 DUF1320 family protein [Caldisericia bacterium]HPQ93066.1 DUF1320 family protein [Caldisericia bacterium]HRV75101.1 DUF1320 family protein [Caldisericia bacterium]